MTDTPTERDALNRALHEALHHPDDPCDTACTHVLVGRWTALGAANVLARAGASDDAMLTIRLPWPPGLTDPVRRMQAADRAACAAGETLRAAEPAERDGTTRFGFGGVVTTGDLRRLGDGMNEVAKGMLNAAADTIEQARPFIPMAAQVDPRTPGWGEEADPCYLGGWRCSVCSVCPYDPKLTPEQKAAELAKRTAPAGPSEEELLAADPSTLTTSQLADLAFGPVPECLAESKGWFCTLPKGHGGDQHEVHGHDRAEPHYSWPVA